MTFREFIINEFKIRGINFRPNYVIPPISSSLKKGGAKSMNVAKVVNPARPINLHHVAQGPNKSQIINK